MFRIAIFLLALSSFTAHAAAPDSTAIQIAAGGAHTCLLTAAGGVKCWGSTSNGQLGGSGIGDQVRPFSVPGLGSGVISITAGGRHTCALTAGGGVKCWGNNANGQLGNNSVVSSAAAVDVSGLQSGVIAIDAGYAHTCALISGGGAKCWGRNHLGQIGTTHYATNGDDHRVPQFVAPRCELDIDGDGAITAATDGVLAARALAGMSGSAVTAGVLGAGATRTTWPQIRSFLELSCGVAGLAP